MLIKIIYDGAFDNISGVAYFSEDLDVTQEEVTKFEESFPYKEKRVMPCQKEYERACSELEK